MFTELQKNLPEARAVELRCLRKIGADVKRRLIRGHEDAERPTALSVHQLGRRHIDLIDIRSFFPVDFDRDEPVIQHPGRLFVFEAFVCQNMAPMTGRITDRQENRFVCRTGSGKRFFPPWIPINRVGGVLE